MPAPSVSQAAMADFIRGLPKAELHLHIEGALEPELMFELARRNGVDLPYASVDDLAARLRLQQPAVVFGYLLPWGERAAARAGFLRHDLGLSAARPGRWRAACRAVL